MDVAEIVTLLSDFNNLEAEELNEQVVECAGEIGIFIYSIFFTIKYILVSYFLENIQDEIKRKEQVLKMLEEELKPLQPIVERLEKESSQLDVEIVSEGSQYLSTIYLLNVHLCRFASRRNKRSLRRT